MLDPLPGSFAELAQAREAGRTADDTDLPPEAAGGGGRRPSALPCRYSNNSPQQGAEGGQIPAYRLRKTAVIIKGRVGEGRTLTATCTEAGEGFDRDGRAWRKGEDGETWEKVLGGLSSAEAKRAFALRQNVEGFTDHYRHEQCGFLTLTAAEADMSPKEFGAIWDDMRKAGRGKSWLKWLRSYVRVLEAQKRGSPHYHLVVATPYDLKPAAFDWEALRGSYEARKAGDLVKARELTHRYAQSATPELREIWAELRDVCRSYGLGRSEMLPFRKEAGAVAHYVGKYLEGGLSYRRDAWKGARRVEYDRKESRAWKRCGSAFGWVSPGATAWRRRVGELARAVGADDPEALRRKLGARWAYYVRPSILTSHEDEWRRLLQYCASQYSAGTVERKPVINVGGQVVAWYPASSEGIDCGEVCTVSSPEGLGIPSNLLHAVNV